jgi:hypothetical protein
MSQRSLPGNQILGDILSFEEYMLLTFKENLITVRK